MERRGIEGFGGFISPALGKRRQKDRDSEEFFDNSDEMDASRRESMEMSNDEESNLSFYSLFKDDIKKKVSSNQQPTT